MTATKRSYTLPPSPSHSLSSSSSSDIEFPISISSRNPSAADVLFYESQLLSHHPSPRISMVDTLPLSSSAPVSANNGGPRDSIGSSTDSQSSFNSNLALSPNCNSSCSSFATEDGEFKRLHNHNPQFNSQITRSNKYFSLSRFSSTFQNENHKAFDIRNVSSNPSVKQMGVTAREVIGKYRKKMKPLYHKLSQK